MYCGGLLPFNYTSTALNRKIQMGERKRETETREKKKKKMNVGNEWVAVCEWALHDPHSILHLSRDLSWVLHLADSSDALTGNQEKQGGVGSTVTSVLSVSSRHQGHIPGHEPHVTQAQGGHPPGQSRHSHLSTCSPFTSLLLFKRRELKRASVWTGNCFPFRSLHRLTQLQRRWRRRLKITKTSFRCCFTPWTCKAVKKSLKRHNLSV